MNIIFLGLPGAGKSTQGKRLSEKLGLPWISIGELLRDAFRQQTPDGIEANKYLARGLNCPTPIKIRILEKILDASPGWILDNYPRTRDDLEHLKKYSQKPGKQIDFVFFLKTSEEEVLARLINKDQTDSGKKRNDTSKENILIRIQRGFKEDANEILNYFQEKKLLIEIDGGKSIEEVSEQILEKLGKTK